MLLLVSELAFESPLLVSELESESPLLLSCESSLLLLSRTWRCLRKVDRGTESLPSAAMASSAAREGFAMRELRLRVA